MRHLKPRYRLTVNGVPYDLMVTFYRAKREYWASVVQGGGLDTKRIKVIIPCSEIDNYPTVKDEQLLERYLHRALAAANKNKSWCPNEEGENLL